MRVSSVVKLPGEMQAVSHDEGRIAMLHQWIEKLCDPCSRLISELNKTVNVSSHFPGDRLLPTKMNNFLSYYVISVLTCQAPRIDKF